MPAATLAELGGSKKPRVTVTLNGEYSFVTTVASRGGRYLIAFSKARREETGFAAGGALTVGLEPC